MSDPRATQGEEEVHSATASETKEQESTANVSKPSTEKEPGEEAKAPPEREEEEPSHEAVGIGVLDDAGRPKQVEE